MGKILRKVYFINWPIDWFLWSYSHPWPIQLCSLKTGGGRGRRNLKLTHYQCVINNHLWSGRGKTLGLQRGYGPGMLAEVGPVLSFFIKNRAEKEPYISGCPHSVQLLSHFQLFATPWTTARQASLSITNCRSPPKPMSIESVIPSNHLILCRPLLLLPSIFPSIRVFSNESTLRIRWPKNWSFSLSISPSNEYSGMILFRMDWLDLLAVQGTLKGLFQHHSSKEFKSINSLVLNLLYSPTLTSIYDQETAISYHLFTAEFQDLDLCLATGKHPDNIY